MFAHLPRRESRPRTPARQAAKHWLAALAAVTCGLLASTATIPAAFATMIPVPPPGGAYGDTPALPAVRVVNVGGMAGWQIILIALGAALAAAVVSVLLDRTLAARRATSATTA
jgi:hypothetical protein